MLKLKMLTRNFHDQLCDKVELKDTELNVFIYAYECGEKYYYNELYENGNKVEESSEELRRLKITFYGVKNINSDFKWDFKEPLNIYELNTTNNKVEFRLYFDDGNENFLSFECIGFDIEYLEWNWRFLNGCKWSKKNTSRKKWSWSGNDILTCQYQEKLFEIFKIDLTESMDFLDSCSAEELYWISEIFEDLSEHFKSQELIECMERNAARTGVDCSVDIEYAKKALD